MKQLLCVLLCAPILVACNQKREISGQVLVSTKGGVSYKLGSVPVLVYPTALLRAQLSNYVAECAGLIQTNKAILEQVTEDGRRAAKQLQTLQDERSALSAKRSDLDDKIADIRRPWRDEDYSTLSQASKKLLAAAQAKIKDLLAEKERLGSNSLAIDAKLRATEDESEQQLQEMRGKIRDCLDDIHTVADFALPESKLAKATSTDADGNFQLLLNGRGDYSLFVHAQRLAADRNEDYFWVSRLTDEPKQRVLLNNLNMQDELATLKASFLQMATRLERGLRRTSN